MSDETPKTASEMKNMIIRMLVDRADEHADMIFLSPDKPTKSENRGAHKSLLEAIKIISKIAT